MTEDDVITWIVRGEATVTVATTRGVGQPICWETLVKGGGLDGQTTRYSSHDEAFKGHQTMCARVRAAQAP